VCFCSFQLLTFLFGVYLHILMTHPLYSCVLMPKRKREHNASNENYSDINVAKQLLLPKKRPLPKPRSSWRGKYFPKPFWGNLLKLNIGMYDGMITCIDYFNASLFLPCLDFLFACDCWIGWFANFNSAI
jgi:hypothetical protein